MEYYSEKDVENAVTVEEIIKLFITVCDPLQHLHNKHYVHCDLKPGHLILNQRTGLIHLIDFELAIKRGGIIKGISREYASPEQLQMLNYLKDLPRKVHYEALSSSIRLDGRTDLYAVAYTLSDTNKKIMAVRKDFTPQNEQPDTTETGGHPERALRGKRRQ